MLFHDIICSVYRKICFINIIYTANEILQGFEAMIGKLNPDRIIVYGKVPDELKS